MKEQGGTTAARVHVTSLGCAKNTVEAQVMCAELREAGARVVGAAEEADVLLVHTCTFIADASQESVDAVLELGRLRREGAVRRLVVTGCLAQRYGRELAELIPEADVIAGTGAAGDVVDLCLGPRPPRVSLPPVACGPLDGRARAGAPLGPWAYLRLGEGCSQRCSFCIIPRLRGPLRTRTIASIVDEARALGRSGVREVNLVGQDTTAFGRDRRGGERLPDLLEALDRVEEIAWVRLLYAYPARVPERLIRVIDGARRVVPYVDVPLQHVDDGVLRRMRRGTSERTVRGLVERLRRGIAGVTLRTTMIVGFPGETERAFDKLLRFVEQTRFERLGAFAFSPEEGTEAASLPDQVPEDVRQERLERLLELQAAIHGAHGAAQEGTVQRVLVQGHDGPLLLGRTASQAPEVDGVVVLDECDAAPGDVIDVEITGADGVDLVGRPLARR